MANALLDCLLIIGSYFVSGSIRTILPETLPETMLSAFNTADLVRFAPISLIYALVLVLVYLFMGDYRTLKLRSFIKEAIALYAANIIGFAFVAAILYTFNVSQFSRGLLLIFYFLSGLFILAKRLLLEKLGNAYTRAHQGVERILLIGSREHAQHYYRDVILKNQGKAVLVGYIAEQENPHLPGYLGTKGEFRRVLGEQRVDTAVYADDRQSAEALRSFMALCVSFGIHPYVIPPYNDFVSHWTPVENVNGLQLVPMNTINTSNILGVNIVVTTMEETIQKIAQNLEDWRGGYICVSNVHTTVTAHDDPQYRRVQNDAVMALPDGGPLSAYSRAHGCPGAERVTGPDLMRELLRRSGQYGWRHFFYGSTPETLELLRQKLVKAYPDAVITGMISPPFRALSPEEDAKMVEEINAAKPDFIWVGLGAPKQEIWMAAHKGAVNGLMLGVGAAFDYEAGNIRRAPQWMQRCNLEWLYRLMQDPVRLFKRYLTTNLRYLWLIRK